MRECDNEELRDALPDFAADRMTGADRARVAAHIADCAECAREVELLRALHRAMTDDAPRVDVARIVAALPLPPTGVATGPVLVRGGDSDAARARPVRPIVGGRDRGIHRRPMWMGWRIAAVASTIAVGGLSVAVVRDLARTGQPMVPGEAVAATPTSPVATPASGGQRTGAATGALQPATRGAGDGSHVNGTGAAQGATPAGLTVAGTMSDLSDGEVEGLLQDLDGLEASPSEEPEESAPAFRAAVAP